MKLSDSQKNWITVIAFLAWFIFLLLAGNSLHGQCPMKMDSIGSITYINLLNQPAYRTQQQCVPVVIHFATIEGHTPPSFNEAQQQIDKLNTDFNNYLSFYLLSVNIVEDPLLYNFNNASQSRVQPYHVDTALNLWYHNHIQYASYSSVCGYSMFPTGNLSTDIKQTNHVAYNCGFPVYEKSTTSHEIGHFYKLYHTFEPYFCQRIERADNSECSTCGDLICDTPPDYGSRTWCINRFNCEHLCNVIDNYLVPYFPNNAPVRNIMSYSYPTCRDHFTPEQLNVAQTAGVLYRYYLSSCQTEITCRDTTYKYKDITAIKID